MNDRQRLEAIVAVVCRYLPPDGITRKEAMSQIIGLVDPLPEKEWVSLTDDEKLGAIWTDGSFNSGVEWAEAKLKEKNT